MIELINFATITGVYDGLEAVIETDEVVTILVDDLEITKSANKKRWTNGNLTYTITINNTTTASYENIVVTDLLEPTLISLITTSVTINGVPAGFGDYTYNSATGLLTINLPNISPQQQIMIKFQVSKKSTEIFKLENSASVLFNINIASSNIVTTIGLSNICGCRINNDI